MPRLAACALLLVAALPLAAGCGNERAGSAEIFDSPGGEGIRRLSYPEAGLVMALPKAFVVSPAKSPQLFRASLEDGFVSAFGYRRAEQLPQTREQLDTARDRLVEAAEERDDSFRLRSSRLTRAAGAPAIELVGDQTISAGRLRLRSLHVYKGDAEYVVEVGAPVGDFRRLDRSATPVIRRSLRVTGQVERPPPGKKKAGGG